MYTNNPLISVIVPVYNSESYLSECVKSILNQTYKNIEVILIDDGSKDCSGELCDRYSAQHDNITTIHKKNGGAGAARNAGIEMAKGEFIMFVDSDDFIDNNMIESLYELHLKTKADVIGSQLSAATTTGEHIRVADLIKKRQIGLLSPEQSLKELLLLHIDWSPCTKIIARKAIGNLRFIEGRTNEDTVFLYFLYQQCNYIYYTKESYYHYRQNPISVTNTLSHTTDLFTNMLYIESLQCKYDIKNELNTYKYRTAISCCNRIIKQRAYKQSKELYHQCKQIIAQHLTSILFSNSLMWKEKIKALILLILH